MHEMCKSALAGEFEAAVQINNQLLGLHANLFVEANPIPVKWALKEMGRIDAGIRLPLTPLDPKYHALLRDTLRQAGVRAAAA
jgi:4-hydroxy-tetrahydrodipicolinate synthase